MNDYRPIIALAIFAASVVPAFAELSALDALSLYRKKDGCRRALCWNSMWRNLPRHEAIGLGGEVNWLIDGPCGERLPAIDLAHVDLTGGEQGPEQHGGSLC